MKALGIILAGGQSERLKSLTEIRASSALPIGSCYRAIDFPISNMSNSGISKVAVITQYNSRSLHDHLSSAKWWDLGRKHGGLFIFNPFSSNGNQNWFKGTADAIYQNMTYLNRSNEEYVIITSGESVYKIDFNNVIDYHEKKGADITIVYQDIANGRLNPHEFGIMEIDSEGRMLNFEEKPVDPQTSLASLGIYVISRKMLMGLLKQSVADSRYDLVKDIIITYRKSLKIYGCPFEGYWAPINSVQNYFSANMDFLRREIHEEFLRQAPYIETKPKDEPPAKYNHSAEVKDSLVGSGSILNGRVERSVLFRRVTTCENSVIKNSIIMEGCHIGSHCVVENAIIDKEVVISDGKSVIGTPDEPLIIGKRALV